MLLGIDHEILVLSWDFGELELIVDDPSARVSDVDLVVGVLDHSDLGGGLRSDRADQEDLDYGQKENGDEDMSHVKDFGSLLSL